MGETQSVSAPRRDGRAGFLLMDLLLALAVMALIAALALPFVRAGSGARPGILAVEIASLLRSSRNAALLSGHASVVDVDAANGSVRSRFPAGHVLVPRPVAIRLLPSGASVITFTADGTSSGGTIALGTGRAAVEVRVNPLTAAVEVTNAR